MIAAIYARKSTDQTGVADEQKSVARQVEHARHFAATKGWTVDDRFIFVDDGISGAEFTTRPGFLRLMNALKPRPAFQVLIMSEESRLGRESIEVSYALKQLVQGGVRVFLYLENRERTLESATDKIMMSLTTFADELEREKARQRTADAMDRKARAGHVTGGKVFGYQNVRLNSHVERRILEPEAAVVRSIYEMYAKGAGYRHIAHRLNERRVPSPRAQRGRPSGWGMGTVRAVLDRALYRGVIEYKKTKKRDGWGRKKITQRPSADVIRVDAPQLRIVSEELAARVDARRADRRERYHRGQQAPLLGQPPLGRYLLSGLLRCPCGANFEAQKNPHGMRHGEVYVCAAHRRKGPSICANRLALPIAETDERILNVIEGEVLSATFIETVLDSVFVPGDDDRAALEVERDDLERQIVNLTAAVKAGGDIPSLVAELKITNGRLVDVRRRLEPREQHDRAQLRAALDQRVDEWRQILRANPAQGRQVLQQLVGPITLWLGEASDLDVATGANPKDQRGTEGISADDVRWSAATKPAGLLAGMPVVQRMASPTGFEPVFWP